MLKDNKLFCLLLLINILMFTYYKLNDMFNRDCENNINPVRSSSSSHFANLMSRSLNKSTYHLQHRNVSLENNRVLDKAHQNDNITINDTVQSIGIGDIDQLFNDAIQSFREDENQPLHNDTIQSLQNGTNQSLYNDTIQSLHNDTIQSLQNGTNQSLQNDTIQSLQNDTIHSLQIDTNPSLQNDGSESQTSYPEEGIGYLTKEINETLGEVDELETVNTEVKNKREELNDELLKEPKLLFPTHMSLNDTDFFEYGRDRLKNQYNLKIASSSDKLIYVSYDDTTDANDKHLADLNCNTKNCRFSRSSSDFDRADAVLFRGKTSYYSRPSDNPTQVWVYIQLESALNAGPPNLLFNWTATYRMDSVIPTPYQIFQPNDYLDVNGYYRPKVVKTNYAQNKTKLVAWFVSNCNAKNNRLKYAHELSEYIDVDIYGNCGPLVCSKINHEQCMDKLKNDYKFYLSFENSNCRGYITEKLFNAYRKDVLPIVMGGHPNDYATLAPPHSYIHVDQFKSAKSLATYLHLLDKNDYLYNAYFAWKKTGSFQNTKFICRLCAMLHIAPKYPVWYEGNLREWWKEGICTRDRWE